MKVHSCPVSAAQEQRGAAKNSLGPNQAMVGLAAP